MEEQNQSLNLGMGNNPTGPAPDNYMVWAILTTILCCLPLGIVSIVKANEVNKKWMTGDYDGARASSQSAKKWAIWSAVAAVAIWVIYIILFMVIGIAGGLFEHLPR